MDNKYELKCYYKKNKISAEHYMIFTFDKLRSLGLKEKDYALNFYRCKKLSEDLIDKGIIPGDLEISIKLNEREKAIELGRLLLSGIKIVKKDQLVDHIKLKLLRYIGLY